MWTVAFRVWVVSGGKNLYNDTDNTFLLPQSQLFSTETAYYFLWLTLTYHEGHLPIKDKTYPRGLSHNFLVLTCIVSVCVYCMWAIMSGFVSQDLLKCVKKNTSYQMHGPEYLAMKEYIYISLDSCILYSIWILISLNNICQNIFLNSRSLLFLLTTSGC